jgi:hypothetical protein
MQCIIQTTHDSQIEEDSGKLGKMQVRAVHFNVKVQYSKQDQLGNVNNSTYFPVCLRHKETCSTLQK